jgi:hypothetical protein
LQHPGNTYSDLPQSSHSVSTSKPGPQAVAAFLTLWEERQPTGEQLVPIPDYQTLMLPVLKAAAAGETRVPVAAKQIADELGLSSEDRDELLPSGRQRILHNRIHWAKFYMTKAGLVESPKRGVSKLARRVSIF